jgi:hypothetical protein
MNKFLTILALTFLACATVSAEHHEKEEMERPYFHASESRMISAAVESINHETREVTVLDQDGMEVSFIASEEARNLDQVAVGDIIHAEYVSSVTVEVVANEGMEPETAEMAAMARTKEGEMPGMVAMDTLVATAVVEEINIEANTFKLRDSDGMIAEYTARVPENLKRAKVGDLVIMTFTEAVAVSVEEQPAAE